METKIQKQIVTLRKDAFRIDFLRIGRIIPKEFYTTIFDKMRTQKNNENIYRVTLLIFWNKNEVDSLIVY